MSTAPLDSRITPHEALLGARIAAALWMASATLVGVLVVWAL